MLSAANVLRSKPVIAIGHATPVWSRLSFPHNTVAVNVDGDDLTLTVQFHVDIACGLQWVVFALGADQHSSSQHAVVLVLFQCELELAWLQQRALQHRVVHQTCQSEHTHSSHC